MTKQSGSKKNRMRHRARRIARRKKRLRREARAFSDPSPENTDHDKQVTNEIAASCEHREACENEDVPN
jgi:hypothetical protein